MEGYDQFKAECDETLEKFGKEERKVRDIALRVGRLMGGLLPDELADRDLSSKWEELIRIFGSCVGIRENHLQVFKKMIEDGSLQFSEEVDAKLFIPVVEMSDKVFGEITGAIWIILGWHEVREDVEMIEEIERRYEAVSGERPSGDLGYIG